MKCTQDDDDSDDQESTGTADTDIITHTDDEDMPDNAHLPSKAVKYIIKAVCGSIPKERGVIVDLLKDKFSVSQRKVSDLTYSQICEVFAKKIIAYKYAKLLKKANEISKSDQISVIKKITLLVSS